MRGLVVLLAVAVIAAAGAAAGRSSQPKPPQFFFTPGPNGANCEIDLVPDLPRRVFCAVEPPKVKASKAIGATLTPTGRLIVCHGRKCVGNPPATARKLRYGHSISGGPFRCTALRRGVHCVVKTLGHGFLLSRRSVTQE
jgi:hypothetical protein